MAEGQGRACSTLMVARKDQVKKGLGQVTPFKATLLVIYFLPSSNNPFNMNLPMD
jgi:hypothetical protein